MCRTITQFSASFAVLAAIRVLAALWMNLHRSSKDAIFCQITMHSGVVFRFSPVERFGLLVLLVSASLGLVKETEIDYCRQVLFEYVFKIIEMRLWLWQFAKRMKQMQSQGFGYFMAGIRTSVASSLT